MSQKELCERSLVALENIKRHAADIRARCDKMELLFADTNNFSYVEYLQGMTVKLEELRENILVVNSQLLTVYHNAGTQKDISEAGKKQYKPG